MTDTDPTIVSPKIWNRNAAQMSAYGRTHEDLSISSRIQTNLTSFIQEGFGRELMGFLMNLLCSQSSDENWNTIPNNLKNLSRRNLGNIYLQISISIISRPSVKPSNNSNCVQPSKICQSSIVNGTQHINLSSSDISLLLIMYSILIKPIIKSDFKIYVIAKISWSCRSYKELWLIWDGMIIVQFFGRAFIVLSNQSKLKVVHYIMVYVLLMSLEAVLNFDKNINQSIKYYYFNKLNKDLETLIRQDNDY